MNNHIELKDFLDFTFLSNLNYAPNAQHAAFVGATCCEEDNQYQMYLQLYDGKTCRRLTTHGKECMYIWEDDEHLLFSNMRDEKDLKACENGEELTVFYRISIYGGEAEKAFSIPLSVSSIRKFDDHRYVFTAKYHIAYSSMYLLDEADKQKRLKEKQDMSDYEVLDEVPFYANGAGFINKTRNSLFLYDVKNNAIERISEEYFSVSDYEISEDDACVYYVGEAYQKQPRNKEGIMQYRFDTKKNECLLDTLSYSIQKVMPWSNKIVVVASDQNTYGLNENFKFYMLNEQTRELELFADYEDAIGSSVGSDCRYGGGRHMKIYEDHLYFLTTVYNRSVLYKLDCHGAINPVYDMEGSVDDFDVSKDTIMFIGMQDMRLQELYVYDIKERQRQQISFYNEPYYKEKNIQPCIPYTIQQGDVTLYGWILEPQGYDSKKSYPAILDIHGGPKTVYGEVYYHEMQVWANRGYFVFFMNPRGGDGRGNEFADIRGKYGTIDYDDLMKFTDYICEQYPSIDSSRLGVTGGSYGGFMTNWIITHTNRFKVAASQRSISNWISFANTSDIGVIFGEDQQGGNIWDEHETLWDHSPLKYVRNCKTPTLFIHSDEDYRCPLSEGYQMYGALLHQGVEARMCIFHGENHELSRSGKPKHRVKRLEEITMWMETYLT